MTMSKAFHKTPNQAKNNKYLDKFKAGKEWLFILLLVSSCFSLTVLAFFFWKLTNLGLQQIHPLMPNIIGLSIGVIFLLIWIGIFVFISNLFTASDAWYSYYIHKLITRYLFPLIIIIGRILGISEDRIQKSFIEINNRLVQIKNLTVRPERMMILLPQCLQKDECTTRITRNIKGCKRCGRCQIAEIIPILERYHILCWVATGGTLARKHIEDYRPDAIIAVACARDLSSGIIDCFPIPVYGIVNKRPEGPCINTLVDIERLNWAIQNFIFK